ncbi:MAG: histidine--tRNA ligase [Firmicutes bacterium]|nr:histidine--tRNA ligase [Bacillota bacterium]
MSVLKPRGTNDFLPETTAKWRYVENKLRELCKEYGYGEIRTPIFEETELFQRGVGDTTDIVQKEMYTFVMKGEHSLTLRPENTASAVRAYLENKLYGAVQPIKVWYMGPMFRYEKPQAGRFRQFHQFGIEIFGSASPLADAEIITFAWEFYRRLGIENLQLHLNSVGCPECRAKHKKALQEYLKPLLPKLCESCQSRYERNPLRILDCKSPICSELTKDAPTMDEFLCDECKEHFEGVKSALDAAGIPYVLNKRLVRGLDYYTKTAFEIQAVGIGAQSAVCGGGRYDGLVEELGGNPTPGVGFAMGMERIFNTLDACGIELPVEEKTDVFVIAAPADNKQILNKAFELTLELRREGIKAEQDLLGRSMKAQFKAADRSGAKFTVIVGESEVEKGVVQVRSMHDGSQEEIEESMVASYINALVIND